MPIVNWYDDRNDQELIKYIPILERLAFVEDV
jgi:TFIIF-interacting CTD phosphatase-like protein